MVLITQGRNVLYSVILTQSQIAFYSVIKDCSIESSSNPSNEAFHLEFEKNHIFSYFVSVKVKVDRRFDVEQMRMRIKPITCFSRKPLSTFKALITTTDDDKFEIYCFIVHKKIRLDILCELSAYEIQVLYSQRNNTRNKNENVVCYNFDSRFKIYSFIYLFRLNNI